MLRPKKYLGAADGSLIYLLGIGADLAVQILASFIIFALSLFASDLTENFFLNAVLSILIQVTFLFVVLRMTRKKKLWYTFDLRKTSKNKKLSALLCSLLGMIGVFISLFCFIGVASLFSELLFRIGYPVATESTFVPLPAAEFIIMIIWTVLFAPFCEELLFRGALLSGLRRNFKDIGCVLLSGLAFSLMHMNPEQTVYQFLLGCAMAYVAIKANSLWPAIVMHALNNLLACLIDQVELFYNVFGAFGDWLFGYGGYSVLLCFALLAGGGAAIFGLGKLIQLLHTKLNGKEDYIIPEEEEPQGIQPFASANATYSVPYDRNIYVNHKGPQGYGYPPNQPQQGYGYPPNQLQQGYGYPPNQPPQGQQLYPQAGFPYYIPPVTDMSLPIEKAGSGSPLDTSDNAGVPKTTSAESAKADSGYKAANDDGGRQPEPAQSKDRIAAGPDGRAQPLQGQQWPRADGRTQQQAPYPGPAYPQYQPQPWQTGAPQNQYDAYHNYNARKNGTQGLFGKKTFWIYYAMGVGVCGLLWLIVFGMGLLGMLAL